jgi:hypothetical protein
MPWGAIIGGAIGGIGSLFGGNKAAKQSMAGFNYLTGKSGVQGSVDAGNAATSSVSQLLGNQPLTPGASSGFTNYLNSTGYNFQKDQGMSAITGSAAAKGTLNSGSTDKALEQYGQGIAGSYFNNYLNQQGAVAGRGLQASGQIGQAGTTGGGNAGAAQQSGTSSAFNQFGGAAGGAYNNYFGAQQPQLGQINVSPEIMGSNIGGYYGNGPNG